MTDRPRNTTGPGGNPPRRPVLSRLAEARLPTRHGVFSCLSFGMSGTHHLALVTGIVAAADILVRVHSECLTGDVFGSQRCDCGEQLDEAMRRIGLEGRGVLVYLRGHEGRGIGIANKLAAYRLQEQGRDTVDANLELGLPVDSRTYDIAASILADLGVRSIRLLTNNPAKCTGLAGAGVRISARLPLTVLPNPENLPYLESKRRRLGHLLAEPEAIEAR